MVTYDVLDDVIIDNFTESIEFRNFSRDLRRFDEMVDIEFFLEEVKGKDYGTKRTIQNIAKNTVDSTQQMGKIYGDITDIGGMAIKSSVGLLTEAISLIVKAAGFICKWIFKIPELILKMIKRVERIPRDVLTKIKGDIQLYITVNDIEDLYNQSLLLKLDNFIALLDQLTKGETWGTMFHNRETDGEHSNDIALCKKLKGEYNYFSKLKFEPTIVQLKDINVVNLYFGGSKSIKFTDLNGQLHECNYYEALIQLSKDIERRSKTIEILRDDLGQKFTKTQHNQTFAKMTKSSQNTITSTIQMTSKCIQVIGNIIKYISIDMKTIEKSCNTILNHNINNK